MPNTLTSVRLPASAAAPNRESSKLSYRNWLVSALVQLMSDSCAMTLPVPNVRAGGELGLVGSMLWMIR